ncbi:MAG TPA: thiamine phosphate synthase [Opitutaceae bacterium]|nr:thiamine phosphate synthase [Opitutaceae bacterium]
MSLSTDQLHPLMCITQDNLPYSHVEQAKRLCGAGAKWIQVRMKRAEPLTWLSTASDIVEICRSHGAICIVNDDIDIALASGADGVHLGRKDGDWREARRQLGPRRILGGTVNNSDDAKHAAGRDCLDYVGIGPWRFTTNKENLAPILGPEGVRSLIRQLDGLPAWAVGGIEADDLAAVRDTGAAGAAVSSALFRGGAIEENYRALVAAWELRQLR